MALLRALVDQARAAATGAALVTGWELTTVSDDGVVAFAGTRAACLGGLRPATTYELHGTAFRTLPRPPGERLATVATVNDLHLGEVECGVLEGFDRGPILRSPPGRDPYPLVMSRAAVDEIAGADPDAVVVKGDLTASGRPEEHRAFLDCWPPAFGPRLHHVRGNHDVGDGGAVPPGGPRAVTLPGVVLALLETAVPRRAGGAIGAEQLAWLDDLAAGADRPVLVLGHHHAWSPDSRQRPDGYFGIHPTDSEALAAVVARRPAIVAYLAGHTHRNRVRRFSTTGAVPWVEVAAVKDFPGVWAEYRVHEGGILQVVHRLRRPDALAWSERTRALFGGAYPAYAFGRLEDRCFGIDRRAGAAGVHG